MLKGNLVKTITSDGLELQGFWMDQKSDVAVFHSHGTAGDFYTHKFIEIEGERLATKKVSFLTANNRGHDVYADILKRSGKNVTMTTIGGGFERFEDCVLDIQAWVDFLLKHGVKKIILQGHSLGPNKIIYYQYLKKNPKVIGQIHISPCNDAGLMLSLLGEKKYKAVNQMVAKKIKEGKGNEMLPKELTVVCPMTALTYSGYLTEEGKGNTFPYHNPKSPKWITLNKITDPMLVIFGSDDPYIKPSITEATKLFKEHVKSTKKININIIKGASHSYIDKENEIVSTILNWIENNFL